MRKKLVLILSILYRYSKSLQYRCKTYLFLFSLKSNWYGLGHTSCSKTYANGGFLVLQCGHTGHNQVSVCSGLGGRSRASSSEMANPLQKKSLLINDLHDAGKHKEIILKTFDVSTAVVSFNRSKLQPKLLQRYKTDMSYSRNILTSQFLKTTLLH